MKELLIGWLSSNSFDNNIHESVLRFSLKQGLVVTEQCADSVLNIRLLGENGDNGRKRIASDNLHSLAWCGHVVAPDLPVWPSADVLLTKLGDKPIQKIAGWDGLFAVALFLKSERKLILAADPFGMYPLYYARYGDGWVFSISIDLLLRCLPAKITLNTTAAAEYLHFHYCLGDKTLANEVVRVPQGCALTLCLPDGRVQCDRLWDMKELPEPVAPPKGVPSEADVSELVTALDTAVERRLHHTGTNLCLLSGGWDSRALAGLMTRRGLSFPTLTTYGDVGNLDDPECARLVADELQLVNTYIPLPPDYLARHWRDKCLATDFATTMHTWLWPLTHQHDFSGAVNMDGIAGDVALKGLMLSTEHLALLNQRDEDGLFEALWRHHGVGDALQRCLKPRVTNEWIERARQSLLAALACWDGHPNALSFFVIGHRTRRAIAASPCLLLERRLRNVAPFLDRDFMKLAMGIPPQHKLSGDLYRQVLRTIRPSLDAIPSSNDKEWPATHPRRRRPVMATAAIQSYRDEIHRAADRLAGFVRPEFLTGEPPPESIRPSSAMAELRLSQALGELAFWMNEYGVEGE